MTRRVTTGDDVDGLSRIVTNAELKMTQIGGGFSFSQLWAADQVPTVPTDGAAVEPMSLFPPPGGTRFVSMQILPEKVVRSQNKVLDKLTSDARQRLLEAGMDDLAAGEAPGLHRTQTIDVGVVISGSVSMELDSGDKLELRPGDTFVQGGTMHSWRNEGDEPAVLFVGIIGCSAN